MEVEWGGKNNSMGSSSNKYIKNNIVIVIIREIQYIFFNDNVLLKCIPNRTKLLFISLLFNTTIAFKNILLNLLALQTYNNIYNIVLNLLQLNRRISYVSDNLRFS